MRLLFTFVFIQYWEVTLVGHLPVFDPPPRMENPRVRLVCVNLHLNQSFCWTFSTCWAHSHVSNVMQLSKLSRTSFSWLLRLMKKNFFSSVVHKRRNGSRWFLRTSKDEIISALRSLLYSF
jgi:hypothetical protein